MSWHRTILRFLPQGALLCLVACGNGVDTDRYQTQARGYEVVDRHTGLIWQRCAEGQGTKWPSGQDDGCVGIADKVSWGSAIDKAQQRANASRKAWRLPTVHELNSIVDIDKHYPAADTTAFPAYWERKTLEGARSYENHYFWSANAYANDPIRGSAWVVDFVSGRITNQEITYKAYVRLVREE